MDERITMIIGQDIQHGAYCEGRAIWLDKEITEFLYSNGRNPFAKETSTFGRQITRGCAGTIRDAFEPACERPWVSWREYVAMGLERG